VGGLKVSRVEITFSGGNMPGSPATPIKKWRLLGAIVEVGGETTFFKLTGPDATVLAARKDFDTLVNSFKVKGPLGTRESAPERRAPRGFTVYGAALRSSPLPRRPSRAPDEL
jgi:hypothetical protein